VRHERVGITLPTQRRRTRDAQAAREVDLRVAPRLPQEPDLATAQAIGIQDEQRGEREPRASRDLAPDGTAQEFDAPPGANDVVARLRPTALAGPQNRDACSEPKSPPKVDVDLAIVEVAQAVATETADDPGHSAECIKVMH
jgi:hypothetical protein